MIILDEAEKLLNKDLTIRSMKCTVTFGSEYVLECDCNIFSIRIYPSRHIIMHTGVR